MSNPQSTPKPKAVFTRLTPEMSREQKFENLKAALEASGFIIREDKPHTNKKD
jgi:hypothetical protein